MVNTVYCVFIQKWKIVEYTHKENMYKKVITIFNILFHIPMRTFVARSNILFMYKNVFYSKGRGRMLGL